MIRSMRSIFNARSRATNMKNHIHSLHEKCIESKCKKCKLSHDEKVRVGCKIIRENNK